MLAPNPRWARSFESLRGNGNQKKSFYGRGRRINSFYVCRAREVGEPLAKATQQQQSLIRARDLIISSRLLFCEGGIWENSDVVIFSQIPPSRHKLYLYYKYNYNNIYVITTILTNKLSLGTCYHGIAWIICWCRETYGF